MYLFNESLLFTLIFRYFLIAGFFYFVFYVWKRKDFSHLKIQSEDPIKKQILKEIIYSLLTFSIYSGISGLGLYWYNMGITKIYEDVNEYGIPYLIVSIFAMILIHDAYFYWYHKLLHSKKWLYQFHKLHHQFTNPTPWSAFALHPVEALLSLGIIPLIIFVIPTHPIALFAFGCIASLYSVQVHLGYDFFSRHKAKFVLLRCHITSSDHNLHHKSAGGKNYGLYFNFWDRFNNTYKV